MLFTPFWGSPSAVVQLLIPGCAFAGAETAAESSQASTAGRSNRRRARRMLMGDGAFSIAQGALSTGRPAYCAPPQLLAPAPTPFVVTAADFGQTLSAGSRSGKRQSGSSVIVVIGRPPNSSAA